MVPRKRILLIDEDADRRGARSYVLEIRGYRVLAAANAEEALAICAGTLLYLIVLALPIAATDELLTKLRAAAPGVPPLVIRAETPTREADDRALLLNVGSAPSISASTPMTDLLDRIKFMAVRKRGPRKGMRRVEGAWAPAAGSVA